MQFAQVYDRVEVDDRTGRPLDPSAFPGKWINSNPDTNGIARLVMTESDGKLLLQVLAIGPNGLIDWGTTDLKIFAATPSSRIGVGFVGVYDFGFAETRLQGSIVKGLLVLA